MTDEPLPIVDRDPEWRMVWEELDPASQDAVVGSVRRGEAVPDRGLAAVAAGAAIRRQRGLTLQIVVSLLFGLVTTALVWRAESSNPLVSYPLWMWIVPVTWTLLIPAASWELRRRARRAEAANRARLGA